MASKILSSSFRSYPSASVALLNFGTAANVVGSHDLRDGEAAQAFATDRAGSIAAEAAWHRKRQWSDRSSDEWDEAD